jgi:hypothetical protein
MLLLLSAPFESRAVEPFCTVLSYEGHVFLIVISGTSKNCTPTSTSSTDYFDSSLPRVHYSCCSCVVCYMLLKPYCDDTDREKQSTVKKHINDRHQSHYHNTTTHQISSLLNNIIYCHIHTATHYIKSVYIHTSSSYWYACYFPSKHAHSHCCDM